MTEFRLLDRALLASIMRGIRTHHELLSRPFRGEYMAARKLDRRLQSMRKRGLIEFRDQVWHVTDAGRAWFEGARNAAE